MTRKVIFVFFTAMLALILLAGCSRQPAPREAPGEKPGETTKETPEKADAARFGPPAPGPKPGEKAPSFQLSKLNTNQEVAFPKDFAGKKVALLFFSSG